MDRYHGMTRKQLAARCAYLDKCSREYDLLISNLDKAIELIKFLKQGEKGIPHFYWNYTHKEFEMHKAISYVVLAPLFAVAIIAGAVIAVWENKSSVKSIVYNILKQG